MPDLPIQQLLARSTLVFTGTVDQAPSSTVSELPVDERTVVVRVDQALHTPEAVDLVPGERVTVQLDGDLPPLSPGDEATFFTNGLVYGQDLAVAEVGRVSTQDVAAGMVLLEGGEPAESPVQAALAQLSVDEVVEHARSAAAVVRAQVTGLAMVPTTGPAQEHDPLWWTATLHADLVARGDPQAPCDISVLYANSLDVRWRWHLKPKAGQSGLWLLHATDGDEAGLAPFVLVHELDLQDSIMLDVLREREI
jgi:hypothetical protein